MSRSEIASVLPNTLPLEDAPSIGYICPLYTELAAVIATFDEYFGEHEVDEDDYHYGRIGNRRVVAAHFLYGEMGPTVAARYAYKLVQAHPSLKNSQSMCLLVGIAGGIWTEDSDVRLGDVVIASRIWNWRDGKQTTRGLEATSFPEHVSKRLRRKLGSFLFNREALQNTIADRVKAMRERQPSNDIIWTYPGKERDLLYQEGHTNSPGSSPALHDLSYTVVRTARDGEFPKVHDGLIASGNVVLKDAASRDSLLEKRVLAVEMEACGVPMEFFTVRGISDYADSHKNDIWQPYAAATAAACARLLIDHFVASADQDLAQLHRLNSSSSEVSLPEPSRHASISSVIMKEGDNVPSREPYSLHSTQSEVVLPPSTDKDNREDDAQQKRLPPPLPVRSISTPVRNIQSVLDTPSSGEGGGVVGNTIQATVIDQSEKLSKEEKDAKSVDDHSALTQYGELFFSDLWKRACRTAYNHTKSPAVVDGERSWENPRVSFFLQKANPSYTSQCFIIFTPSDKGVGLHDRVWLPLSGVRFGVVDDRVMIAYETFPRTDEPLSASISRSSGFPLRAQLILESLDGNTEKLHLLVEKLSIACKSLLPNAIASNVASVMNAEVAHEVVKINDKENKTLLRIHQVDSTGMHYCAIAGFGPNLDLRLKVLPDRVEVHLKTMHQLQYNILWGIVYGKESDAAAIFSEVIWANSNETYRIRKPYGQLKDLLNSTVGVVSGWTVINVSKGITINSIRDRTVTGFGSSFVSKGMIKTFNKLTDQANSYLTVWQKGDALRLLMTTSNIILKEEDDSTCGIWDGWTINAGRGEIFLPKEKAGKLRVAFELEQRSKEGNFICFKPDNWFDLPESHRFSCFTSLEMTFPTPEVYETFRSSINQRFWRK